MMAKSIRMGIFWTLFLAIPMAGLIALVYRFPVPLSGYVSGFVGMFLAMLGAIFYFLMGGFLVLPLLGALAGWSAHNIAAKRQADPQKLIVAFSAVAAFCAAFPLAILDKILGHAW
jgi:hypothetical protein